MNPQAPLKESISTLSQALDAYWTDVLAHRMPLEDEVDRLYVVLRGFHSMAREVDLHETGDLLDFHGSKRPYGNKDVAASVVFNLGWDYQRRLCSEHMPEQVALEAMAVHRALRAHLEAMPEICGS